MALSRTHRPGERGHVIEHNTIAGAVTDVQSTIAELSTAAITDSTDKRFVTDTQRSVLANTSGVNTGDQTLAGLGGVATSRQVNGHTLTADVTVTKSDVGLGNVDNTADTAKPVSTAAQTALDGKPATSRTGTKLAYDLTTATTDGSGYVTITHGLGATPKGVLCSGSGNTGGSLIHTQNATDTYTSTTFRVRAFNSVGGGLSSTSLNFAWMAFT